VAILNFLIKKLWIFIPIKVFLCPYRSLSSILYRPFLTLRYRNINDCGGPLNISVIIIYSGFQVQMIQRYIHTISLAISGVIPQGHSWLEESACIAYHGFVKLCSLASTKGFITRIDMYTPSPLLSFIFRKDVVTLCYSIFRFSIRRKEKRRVKRPHIVHRKKEGKIGKPSPFNGRRKQRNCPFPTNVLLQGGSTRWYFLFDLSIAVEIFLEFFYFLLSLKICCLVFTDFSKLDRCWSGHY